MDLSRHGWNTMLVPAKGVQILSRTWCALNPKASRDYLGKLLGTKIDYACSNADCTPLGYSSTCNDMDVKGNASYAFNAYYQTQSIKDDACDLASHCPPRRIPSLRLVSSPSRYTPRARGGAHAALRGCRLAGGVAPPLITVVVRSSIWYSCG